MEYFWGILIFFFGAALGSFIMVIANRYNTGLSFLRGRSICFACNAELQKKDLIPIFSFLFLRGKCRYCQSKISKETIIVELLMGVLLVILAFQTGILGSHSQSIMLINWFNFLILISIFATIALISIYDLKHFIIPDFFLVIFFILSILSNLYSVMLGSISIGYLFLNLCSGIILFIPFFLIFLFRRCKIYSGYRVLFRF